MFFFVCVLNSNIIFFCLVANARYIVGPLVAKTTSGKDIETDLVFFCNGAHINSASYQESLGKAVNEHVSLSFPFL